MSLSELRNYCREQAIPVDRNALRDQVLNLVGERRVAVMRVSLDTTKCRGFFISARNKDHPLIKQFGTNVIGLSRDLNRCWSRIVFVKEMMHFFDGIDEMSDSGQDFDQCLSDLTSPGSLPSSQQFYSEAACFWRALACLCPEKERLKFQDLRSKNKIDDYSIALQLRIPEQYVSKLFSAKYTQIIDSVMPLPS